MTDTTAAVPTKPGIYNWIGEDAYHADRASLSASGAKLLLSPNCPAKFRERMDNPPTPKREYDIGHLVHKLVLGKGADIVEIDAPDYRTKDAREARDKAHANGKIPALAHEVAMAQRMASSVFAHPVAGPLMSDPRNETEMSLYTDDPETGIRLRGRIDCLHFAKDGRVWLIDLKTSTTADPDVFRRKAADLGYHMQADWYLGLMTLLKLAVDPAFVFVVVEKTPPYLVSVVEFDGESLAEGHRRNRAAIDTYVRCMARGVWPSYPDTDEIVPISLPPWAFRESTINDLFTFEVD